MSKVILDDNTTARIYANSSGNLLPFSDYDGFRMYIPARSTVYENVKGNWIVKYCNKSCMPIYELAILDEAIIDKL